MILVDLQSEKLGAPHWGIGGGTFGGCSTDGSCPVCVEAEAVDPLIEPVGFHLGQAQCPQVGISKALLLAGLSSCPGRAMGAPEGDARP